MNASQQSAVDNWSPKQLIIAGAGSGKTTTMAAAINAEIGKGVSPNQMAAITFTGSAASVLRQRVPGISYVGTLHGFMLHLMRKKNPRLSVLDQEDADDLLKKSVSDLGYKLSWDALIAVKRAWWNIAPNLGTMGPITKEIRAVANYYRDMDADSLDYDSILSRGLDFVRRYNDEINYAGIFVDEFQDSASVDLAIYDALAEITSAKMEGGEFRAFETRYRHMFFVGDPNQSIYGFRGGRVENILELDARPDVHTFYLNENYRSVPGIVEAATKLIAKNKSRLENQLPVSMRGHGMDTPSVHKLECSDHMGQCQAVLAEIRATIALGVPEAEIAVLTRTNNIATELKVFLTGSGVPVRSLESIAQPRDWKFARRALAVIAYPENWSVAFAYLKASGKVFSHAERAELMKLNPIEYLKTPQVWRPVDVLDRLTLMGVTRGTIIDLKKWLEDHPCMTAQDMHIGLLGGDFSRVEGQGVYVGTVHSSKGHEWHTVLVPGVEKGIFPLKSGDPEEERRLMYVAITRAKDRFRAYAGAGRVVQYNPAFSKYVETGPSEFFLEI